jgi:hypothetical protein
MKTRIFERVPITLRLDQIEYAGLELLSERHGHFDPQKEARQAIEEYIVRSLTAEQTEEDG